jgi:hypothetical protein
MYRLVFTAVPVIKDVYNGGSCVVSDTLHSALSVSHLMCYFREHFVVKRSKFMQDKTFNVGICFQEYIYNILHFHFFIFSSVSFLLSGFVCLFLFIFHTYLFFFSSSTLSLLFSFNFCFFFIQRTNTRQIRILLT